MPFDRWMPCIRASRKLYRAISGIHLRNTASKSERMKSNPSTSAIANAMTSASSARIDLAGNTSAAQVRIVSAETCASASPEPRSDSLRSSSMTRGAVIGAPLSKANSALDLGFGI